MIDQEFQEQRLCECGCGKKTSIIKWSDASKGIVRGEYRRFLNRHYSRTAAHKTNIKRRNEHYNWKGGKFLDNRGYILVLNPKHRLADANGYVFEHRLVAEEKLGRQLKPKECVHHINEIRTDNCPETAKS